MAKVSYGDLLLVGLGVAVIIGTVLVQEAVRFKLRRKLEPPDDPGPADPYAEMVPPTGCEPTEKLGVRNFRGWVLNEVGGEDWGIVRDCTVGKPSHHHEGRAWDWHPPSDEAADELLDQLEATGPHGDRHDRLRRVGLDHIIWQHLIWTVTTKGWAPYHGEDSHTTHVHFGFGWPGARAETSWHRRT